MGTYQGVADLSVPFEAEFPDFLVQRLENTPRSPRILTFVLKLDEGIFNRLCLLHHGSFPSQYFRPDTSIYRRMEGSTQIYSYPGPGGRNT